MSSNFYFNERNFYNAAMTLPGVKERMISQNFKLTSYAVGKIYTDWLFVG